jgi:hypothetical protein
MYMNIYEGPIYDDGRGYENNCREFSDVAAATSSWWHTASKGISTRRAPWYTTMLASASAREIFSCNKPHKY